MAIEFALVMILLVMLVFGITEIGRALYQLNTMAKAATSGARYMARAYGAVEFDPDAEDPECEKVNEIWDVAVDKARNIVLYGTEITGTETLLPGMIIDNDDIELETRTDDATGSVTGCVIMLTVKASYTSLFSGGEIIPFPDVEDIEMSETVEERYIGE